MYVCVSIYIYIYTYIIKYLSREMVSCVKLSQICHKYKFPMHNLRSEYVSLLTKINKPLNDYKGAE